MKLYAGGGADRQSAIHKSAGFPDLPAEGFPVEHPSRKNAKTQN